MAVWTDIKLDSQCPVQQVIDEQYDRARIAQKFSAEHHRRSQAQKHRQLCERVARIFQEVERNYGAHERND